MLASRLIDFKPGIVYGFIASTAFLVPAALDRREEGKVALYPALVLLGVSLVAWLLMGFVRGMETGADGWPLPFAEAILAVIFVGGLEGLFFNMIPLTFMDGKAVADWSRVVWIVTFGLATFLFWQLLINPDAGYLDALKGRQVPELLSLYAPDYADRRDGMWGDHLESDRDGVRIFGWSAQEIWNETASVNLYCGPPLSALNLLPASVNSTARTVPAGPLGVSAGVRNTRSIREFGSSAT